MSPRPRIRTLPSRLRRKSPAILLAILAVYAHSALAAPHSADIPPASLVSPQLQTLIDQLQSDDEKTVRTGLTAALRLGNRAHVVVPSIWKLLSHPDFTLRLEAARTLLVLDAEQQAAVAALHAALKHDDPAIRTLAARTVGDIAHPPPRFVSCWGPSPPPLVPRPAVGKNAVPFLIVALADPESEVRAAAATALGRVGADAAATAPALTKALNDEIPAVQLRAIQAVANVGTAAKPAAPILSRMLSSPDQQLAVHAAHALSRIDAEAFRTSAVPFLITIIRDSSADRELRHHAARVLEQLGPDSAAVVPRLCELLTDPDLFARRVAATSLAFGPEAKAAVEPLAKALADSDLQLRVAATRTLGEIGPAAASAVPLLIQGLADSDRRIGTGSAYALGKIGPPAHVAIPVLLPMLFENESGIDGSIATSAAWALGELRAEPEKVVPELTAVLRHHLWGVREAAVRALGKFGKHAKPAVPTLIELLKHDDYLVLLQAAAALKQIDPDSVATAIAQLVEALGDNDLDIRRKAAHSLGIIDSEATSVAALTRTLQDDPSTAYAAARALGMMGPKAKTAVPALLKALNSNAPGLKSDAAEALRKIDPQAADRAGLD